MSTAFFVLLYLAVVGRVLVAGDVPAGVQSNFNIADLTSLVSPLSTWSYSHPTVADDLICPNALYTCLGSMSNSSSTVFSLLACAETSFFMNDGQDLGSTSEAVMNNDAYWYRIPGTSVGFSGSSSVISLGAADVNGQNDPDRLSWHMTGDGGYRSGATLGLNDDSTCSTWQKVVACVSDCPPGLSTVDNVAPVQISDCTRVKEGWRIDSSDLFTPVRCELPGVFCPGGNAVGTVSVVSINTDSTDTHHPCNNSVNGVETSATDVNGNIIKGCGNLVSNVTNGTAPVKVRIYGSGNVVQNDIVTSDHSSELGIVLGREDDTSSSSGVVTHYNVANRNTIVGNTADYIGLYVAEDNVVTQNVAKDGGIQLSYAANDTVTHNAADYIYVSSGSDNVVESNVADYQGIFVYYGDNNTVSRNTADYIYVSSGSDNVVESNEVDYGGIELYYAGHKNVVKHNHAGQKIYLETDTSAVIESNDGAPSLDHWILTRVSNFDCWQLITALRLHIA